MKKRMILSSIVAIFLIIGISLMAILADIRKVELPIYSSSYGKDYSLQNAEYVDSYQDGNERFALYTQDGHYFLVWSQKNRFIPWQYDVVGGTLPQLTETNPQYSEFQKFDSMGFVYILYGAKIVEDIPFKVSNVEGSFYEEALAKDGYFFTVYTGSYDSNVFPDLTGIES